MHKKKGKFLKVYHTFALFDPSKMENLYNDPCASAFETVNLKQCEWCLSLFLEPVRSSGILTTEIMFFYNYNSKGNKTA